MTPVVVLDAHWRQVEELFSDAALAALKTECEVVWGQNGPIPADVLAAGLARASVYVAATPVVTGEVLEAAPHLKAVIEVSGAFPDTIDYAACAARGVEVLSCSPGFRQSVAEMALAMALSGARGLVQEHEAFRRGEEGWLQDNPVTDFTLYGGDVGFAGFGQIGQEIARLMVPFQPRLRVFDPWLPDTVAAAFGAEKLELEEVLRASRCLFIAAVPSAENEGLIGAEALAHLPDHALVVLISRAHLVDFDALVAEASSGRLRVATDVFPSEPTPSDAPIRAVPNAILSPHRAAAVAGGRHLIGDMVLSDIRSMTKGLAERRLLCADPDKVALVSGVGDAQAVTDMAAERG